MKKKLGPLSLIYTLLTTTFGFKLIYGTDVGMITHLVICLVFIYFLIIRKEKDVNKAQ